MSDSNTYRDAAKPCAKPKRTSNAKSQKSKKSKTSKWNSDSESESESENQVDSESESELNPAGALVKQREAVAMSSSAKMHVFLPTCAQDTMSMVSKRCTGEEAI